MTSSAGGSNSLIGREIAGYRLVDVLGTGMIGVVFKATRISSDEDDNDHRREVAIKVLQLPLTKSAHEQEVMRSRFEREFRILQQLKHPHIVPVLDFGEHDGLTYMVMPFFPSNMGAQLSTWPLADVDRAITQLADALDYAHNKGIIHRDIKPQNILLDSEHNAYLADFSIAKLVDETQLRLTSTTHIPASGPYIAPERYQGKEDKYSDIYGLGVVAFELVTGQRPFDADDPIRLMAKISTEEPPRPSELRTMLSDAHEDLPEPAEAAIWQALAKRPADRYGTAADFAQAFSTGLKGQWDSSVHPIPKPFEPAMPLGSVTTENIPLYHPPHGATYLPVPPATQNQWGRILGTAALGVLVLTLILVLVLGRSNQGANVGGSQTPIAHQGGIGKSTPTMAHTAGVPTATPRHKSKTGGTNPTSTPKSVPTSGPVAHPTATPTQVPTATPRPPTPTPTTPPPPPTATPVPPPSPSIQIGWSSNYSTYVWVTYRNFSNGNYTYTCNFGSGGNHSYIVTISANPETIDNGKTCYDGYPGDTIWISIGSVKSNVLTVP